MSLPWPQGQLSPLVLIWSLSSLFAFCMVFPSTTSRVLLRPYRDSEGGCSSGLQMGAYCVSGRNTVEMTGKMSLVLPGSASSCSKGVVAWMPASGVLEFWGLLGILLICKGVLKSFTSCISRSCLSRGQMFQLQNVRLQPRWIFSSLNTVVWYILVLLSKKKQST